MNAYKDILELFFGTGNNSLNIHINKVIKLKQRHLWIYKDTS